MITLRLSNLHWLGDTPEEQQQDLCLHGHVLLKFDEDIISDEEWCVSAAALRFMRSVFSNYFMGEEQHMLPCCGYFMIATDDNQSVDIYGCCNGVDFDVLHDGKHIIIKTDDSKTYRYSFCEYRDIVVAFANEVEQFFINSPERIVANVEPEKSGFSAFRNEWFRLKDKIKLATPDSIENVHIDYSDYISITEKDILKISSAGISYTGGFINFRECAYYFKDEHGGDGKCVGERDITCSNPCFIFYTAPLTIHMFFIPKGKFAELFSKIPIYQRFHNLQKQLNHYGYTTRDLS